MKLEQEKGFKITFVNTPLNIKKLGQNLPTNTTIRLLEVPFDTAKHGLPPNSDSTETLSLPLMLRLIEASPSLLTIFRTLISRLACAGDSPACVVSDMFFA
ncbi:hypothetical protein ACS0TY_025613 [Phlomoides rotata]